VKLKVFNGSLMVGGRQVSAVVATTSIAKAAKLTNESVTTISKYWSITANKESVAAAMASPVRTIRSK